MKQKRFITMAAILSAFFVVPGPMVVSPALQNIAEAFPKIPYTTVLLLSTLPSLFLVPSILISGAIAGTKIKYKTLLIVSNLLFIVSGALPFFIKDFYMILITRAFVGIALGLASPLSNALIMRLYNGQERANMLGAGTVVINVASTFFMILSGVVCAVNVNYTWLVHLTVIIPLILLTIFLPEPEKEAKSVKEKIKIPAGVIILAMGIGLVFIILNPLLLNMSAIIIKEKIGNSASAGVVLAMYTVGGMIGGAIYGKAYKLTGKYVITLSLIFFIIGLFVCNYSHNILLMTIGCVITGIGIFILFPAVNMNAGQMIEPKAFAMASGVIIACMNLGGFLTPFYIGLLTQLTGNSSPRFPIVISAILGIVIAVIWTLIITLKKKAISGSFSE